MNGVDILLVAIVLVAIWSGWQKGFLAGFFELVSWIGSLAIGFFTYGYATELLQRLFPRLGVWTFPVAFMGMVVLSRILIALVLQRIDKSIDGRLHRHSFNHVLGIVPGFVNGVLFATVLAAVLFLMPITNGITSTAKSSPLANTLVAKAEWANDKLAPIFSDAVNAAKPASTGANETVNLHFTVKNAKVRQDLEAQMLVLVNEERQKAGLQPVVADPEMTLVARAHSQDMFARGYFSHYTPEKKDPFDRMKAAKVKFMTAGENLALGQTLQICHRGLMNSPGHRANILQPAFGRLGIGILDGGIYGLMISQEFRN
jgi:uncharacterized protein YkwD